MNSIEININKIIHIILCCFAFLIPFELALEIFFDIKTILKPYRIASILIISIYAIKILHQGFPKINFENDLPLYLIFVYGIIISLVQMVISNFSMRLFNNDIFQITLLIFIYFTINNIDLNRTQWIRILWCLTIGIILNSCYLFNDFFFHGHFGRQGGLMDNPNYVSLSIVVAFSFIVYRISVHPHWFHKLFYTGIALFLLFVFPVTGSRSGLFILAVICLLLFFFASWRSKIMAVMAITVLFFFFLNQNIDQFRVGASFVLTNRVIKNQGVEDVRIPIWRGALKAGSDSYFLGIGIGQFKAKFPRIFQTEYHKTILECVNRGAYLSTHNDYIALLVVYGLPCLLLYLFYLFQLSRKLLWKNYHAVSKKEARFQQFNLMILTALAIFGIGSENFLSPLYWLLLALCSASLSTTLPSDTEADFLIEQ